MVKASITGSIIGNVLLVFGAAAFAGGLRHRRQTFNRTAVGVGATLLVLSSIALLVPAIFHHVAGVGAERRELRMSVEIAIVGNAAEHSTAVIVALGDRMELAA